jgi:hydroxyacylglutathione hydrolase
VPNIPLGYLAERLQEIPRDRPVVVHCQTGGRSAIAASVLQAVGFKDVFNLAGGYADWQASGNPTVSGAEAPASATAA